MDLIIAKGLLIPFLGTSLGSACVLFMKKELDARLQKGLSGFAAGVMIAASVWSLLIPSMNQAGEQGLGNLAFVPAVIGFCLGMLFLLLLDVVIPHMHLNETVEGPKKQSVKNYHDGSCRYPAQYSGRNGSWSSVCGMAYGGSSCFLICGSCSCNRYSNPEFS